MLPFEEHCRSSVACGLHSVEEGSVHKIPPSRNFCVDHTISGLSLQLVFAFPKIRISRHSLSGVRRRIRHPSAPFFSLSVQHYETAMPFDTDVRSRTFVLPNAPGSTIAPRRSLVSSDSRTPPLIRSVYVGLELYKRGGRFARRTPATTGGPLQLESP